MQKTRFEMQKTRFSGILLEWTQVHLRRKKKACNIFILVSLSQGLMIMFAYAAEPI